MFAGDGRALFIAEFLPRLFIGGVRLKRAEANVSAPAFRQILGILLVIVDIALPSVRALTLIPDFGAGAGSAATKIYRALARRAPPNQRKPQPSCQNHP